MARREEGVPADKYNTLMDRTSDLGNRIHVSLDFLSKNSTSLPEVLVNLTSHGLLRQPESEVIDTEKSNYDSFRQLFTILIPRLGYGDNSRHFINAFQNTGNEHILERLKMTAVMPDFNPRSADMSSPSVRFNVLEPVPSFVGREKFLRELHQQILQSHQAAANVPTTSEKACRICVVTGLGGIGKTETARKYIHSYGHCYQHVVWIDAEEHKTAENQFRRLAIELQLSSKDIDNKAKDFDVLLKEIYDRLCTNRTLVILDKAEVSHDSDPKRPGAACFLPKCLPPTHSEPVVLITSRQIDWPDFQSMPLPLLTPQESSKFLFLQLKLEECHANENVAETLSETFGGLPLALQAAAAVILQECKGNKLMGKDVYTIQNLLSDYNEGKREVLQKRPPGSSDVPSLMFLWKVSLDKIRQQPDGHLATEILNVMAHLSPTNIPKELLFFIFNFDDDLKKALELLVDYSFVHNSRKHFSIHRVLQDVTLAHLEAPTEEHPKEEELIILTHPLIQITTALKKYWPTVPKSSKAYDAVHDNLVHVTMSHVLPKLKKRSQEDLHFTEFIEFVLEEIKETRWVEAEKCCRVLIAYFNSSSLPSYPVSNFQSRNFKDVCRLQRQLAGILQTMGRYKEAVDICQELLSSFNSMEDQTDVMSEKLTTMQRLAWILDSQGEYVEAIKLYSSVSDLRSKLHGPTHKFTLTTKNNLALALHNSGRLSEAKTLYAEILEVEMKYLGPLHPSTLTTKHNMTMMLKEEGHYDDALEMLREVVKGRDRELGPLHASTLRTQNCMANVLKTQGKYEDALRLYAHVISSYEKASAASHPECLAVKNNMAVILRKQGKYEEALKLYEEVLELTTKYLGPVHPSTLVTKYNMGCLHLKMGDFEKTESIAKEVLAARQATLPTDHQDIKNTEELYDKARFRNGRSTHEKQ